MGKSEIVQIPNEKLYKSPMRIVKKEIDLLLNVWNCQARFQANNELLECQVPEFIIERTSRLE